LPALIRRFVEAKQAGASSVTCWGTGTPMREFLHVDDLGEAVVFALEHWDPNAADAPHNLGPDNEDLGPLNHLNVGTGVDVTIREVAKTVAEVAGFEGSIEWDNSKPDGTPRKLLDVSRLRQLGWSAQLSLCVGLGQVIEDYRLASSFQRLSGHRA